MKKFFLIIFFIYICLSLFTDNYYKLSEAITENDYEKFKYYLNEKIDNEEIYSLLIQACEKGRVKIVRLLLNKGADINRKTSRYDGGRTLLIKAVLTNNIELVKLILSNGANVNDQDDFGETPLIYAIRMGKIDLVKLLIQSGADVNFLTDRGTALVFASGYGHYDIAKLLLGKGAKVNINYSGYSALMEAAITGHFNIVKLLITNKADVNYNNNEGLTALMGASSNGYKEIAEYLLKHGANIFKKDIKGKTALGWALAYAHKDIIKILKTKIDKNKIKQKENELFLAIERNKIQEIKKILKTGTNINNYNENSFTPLTWAAIFNNNPEVFTLLIKSNADVNAKDPFLMTPLSWASMYCNNIDIIKILIDYGADIESEDNAKRRPLGLAVRYSQSIEIIETLIKSGAMVNTPKERLNATDQEGNYYYYSKTFTPLMAAAFSNRKADIVKLLLKYGAEVNAYTGQGKTPIMFAAQSNQYPEVIKILVEAGAKVNVMTPFGKTPLLYAEENKNPEIKEIIKKLSIEEENNLKKAEKEKIDLKRNKVELFIDFMKKKEIDKITKYISDSVKYEDYYENIKKEKDLTLKETKKFLIDLMNDSSIIKSFKIIIEKENEVDSYKIRFDSNKYLVFELINNNLLLRKIENHHTNE